ncbi:MAG: DUF3135 domain-containing protein [Methylococcaceae bacterium]|nr:DUF3135 domain-containing protein [Methylococcaceae bacterium]
MTDKFDFDTLSRLYKTDPEQFQLITRQMIEAYIASIPDEISRKKCAGTQFRLDHELGKYNDPIARMNKMVEIFWQGVYQLHSSLNGTIEIKENTPAVSVIWMNDIKTDPNPKK